MQSTWCLPEMKPFRILGQIIALRGWIVCHLSGFKQHPGCSWSWLALFSVHNLLVFYFLFFIIQLALHAFRESTISYIPILPPVRSNTFSCWNFQVSDFSALVAVPWLVTMALLSRG